MRYSKAVTGASVTILMACGGGVSLGTTGGPPGDGGASDSGSSGIDSAVADGSGVDCSDRTLCGPALGMPAQQCSDGTIGGNTGRCISNGSGGCHWEIRTCPPPTADAAATDGALVCPSSGGGPSGQSYTTAAACGADADCTYVRAGCYCAQQPALGVAKTFAAEAAACQADAANNCALGCASGFGVSTEDGLESPDAGAVAVRCEKDGGTAGLCRTYQP